MEEFTNSDKEKTDLKREKHNKNKIIYMFSAVWSRDCAAFFYSTRLLLFRLVFRSLVKRGFQYNRARAPPVQFEPKTQIERRIKLKTTFLVRKIKDDAKSGLVRVSAAEWTKILKENKNLPTEQKRYFIIDCIDDDRMYIEVSLEEHRDWNIRHTISERNRKFGEKFSFCSLEQDIIDHEGISTEDILINNNDSIAESESRIHVEEFEAALKSWEPWAYDIYLAYKAGKRRSCTSEIAKKYGVSEQTARSYKRKFEKCLKNFGICLSF